MKSHLQHILCSMEETIKKLKVANEFHEIDCQQAEILLKQHMKELENAVQREHSERSDKVIRRSISQQAIYVRDNRRRHEQPDDGADLDSGR